MTTPVRIADIRTATTSIALPQPLQLGAMTVTRREYVGVRVIIDTPTGSVSSDAYALTREAPMAEIVDRLIAPHVIGRELDPDDPGPGVRSAWEAALRGSAIIGRVGLARRAIGLVDVALWGAAGRLTNLPVWRLLDDMNGDSELLSPTPRPVILVAAYPTVGRSAQEVAQEVLGYARSGWPLLKISRSTDVGLMHDLIRTLSDELPAATGGLPVVGKRGLVIDIGFGWSNAAEASADLQAWGLHSSDAASPALAWLEDPLLPEDVAGSEAIRAGSGLPLSIGDEVTDPRVLHLHEVHGTLDVPRVDVVAIGGFTAADPLVRSWAQQGLPISSHVYPEASVHLGGARGIGIETFDRSPAGNPYDPSPLLVQDGPLVEPGRAFPPDSAGLGFTLNPTQFNLGESS